MINAIRRLLDWFDPPKEDPLMPRVRELVAWAETFALGTSGEYKRHQVYSRLRKEHPFRRDIGLLIEQALQ